MNREGGKEEKYLRRGTEERLKVNETTKTRQKEFIMEEQIRFERRLDTFLLRESIYIRL